MPAETPSIVWFREDLRLADNPALNRAVERGGPVVALFILDDETPGNWRPGGAARWWLHHSLAALAADLEKLGAPLVLRSGEASRNLDAVIAESGAGAVFWNRSYMPFANARDAGIKQSLKERGLTVESFNGRLLFEPWTPRTGSGDPYRVFTPFWKAILALGEPEAPLPAPAKLPSLTTMASESLDDWRLAPSTPDWAGGLRESWTPGEAGAKDRLEDFLDEGLAHYAENRNRPDRPGTSRLSPFLRWGEISPRQVWHATRHRIDASGGALERPGMAFLREVGWREFSYHLLYWWPDLPDITWKSQFHDFPWRDDEAGYRAWTAGRTGFPIVDAGMRELWHSGWMHNRVRMIVASFLTKNLLIPWQDGARWFWDTLVDADLANNTAGWQWTAGCGADAAPYFRVFNPVLQGQKFDPTGEYVRRWCPELASRSGRELHEPSSTAIVDLKASRRRALAAYDEIKAR